MNRKRLAASRLNRIEALEPRLVLSMTFGGLAAAERGNAGGSAPAIRLDLVALHELGHSLGLAHTNNTGSIMDPYYNANYDLNNFANDPVLATLHPLYATSNNGGWENSLDSNTSNGIVDLTYSFMPDGARMDKGSNTLFATFNAIFPNTDWQAIFAAQLQRWDNVEPYLAITKVNDGGQAFNTSGSAQNDPRFGDIRIGAHQFDGAGKVLAHAYYPPPNGGTVAGDAHFDHSENWVLSGAASASTIPQGSGASGSLVFATSAANDSAVPLSAGALVSNTPPQDATAIASIPSSDFSPKLRDDLPDGQGTALEIPRGPVATRRAVAETIDIAFASLGLLDSL